MSMKKRVLILYARYGSGHKSIAEYIYKYINSNNSNVEAKILDITDYGNFAGRVGVKIFDWISKKRPERLFDVAYEITDTRLAALSHNLFAIKSYDNLKLRKEIVSFMPDIVISTHFYGSDLVNYYNGLGFIKTKILTVITDYKSHECWTRNYKTEAGFIVGNDVVKKELVERGIPKDKIFVFGLPINNDAIKTIDNKEKTLKKYKLSGKRPIYLFFGGSTSGSMYYYDYLKYIAKANIDKDIVFISGNNMRLKNKSEIFIKDNNISNVKVLGYSKDVFNLMNISDLVISKPGGATVTECLEMRKPMLLVPGLGGQEKYNAKFIKKKKYGLVVRNILQFKKTIKYLEENPYIIEKINRKMSSITTNDSVEKINELINKL